MDDFTLPKLNEPTEIPKIDKGAMAHSKPFCATPEHQSALGFPGELVEDWHDKAIAKFGNRLSLQPPIIRTADSRRFYCLSRCLKHYRIEERDCLAA